MDGIWFVYLVLAAIPGLILFAVIYKYIEVLQASRWPSTQGRIVVSTTEARSVKSGGPDTADTEERTFARVEFEYKLGSRTYRGNRVSLGEDMGNFEVAETLAKYPVGKAVTVYYNPDNRQESVLERDAPKGLWKGVAIIVLVLVAIIVGSIVGYGKLAELVQRMIANTERAPFVAACVGFAALASLVIWGIQRSAARTLKWPSVPGRIEKSGVREFQELEKSGSGHSRWRTRYRADVIYGYDVAGVRYTGDRSASGARVSASTDAFAQRAAAAYPVGKQVTVHYNPENPAESTITPGAGKLWLLWIAPAIVLVIAYLAAR